ncbi:hypothetical protein PLANPX_2752 [Lacipirellula parvula]|uniref:Uncharacterized protein n=1 Tax=Lacipirellula parvula TaxID=2650471 RepID=A0A5K7X900_9BACT|nr:hypothetical protein PLANPX_2752 [Lacipirellula parvula]
MPKAAFAREKFRPFLFHSLQLAQNQVREGAHSLKERDQLHAA